MSRWRRVIEGICIILYQSARFIHTHIYICFFALKISRRRSRDAVLSRKISLETSRTAYNYRDSYWRLPKECLGCDFTDASRQVFVYKTRVKRASSIAWHAASFFARDTHDEDGINSRPSSGFSRSAWSTRLCGDTAECIGLGGAACGTRGNERFYSCNCLVRLYQRARKKKREKEEKEEKEKKRKREKREKKERLRPVLIAVTRYLLHVKYSNQNLEFLLNLNFMKYVERYGPC